MGEQDRVVVTDKRPDMAGRKLARLDQRQHLVGQRQKTQRPRRYTVVFHNAKGHFDAPAVKSAVEPVLTKIKHDPDVVSVLSPFTKQGAQQGKRGWA